jgi:hypothetical protein
MRRQSTKVRGQSTQRPLATQHYPMLARNPLYTGVTRGKQLIVLIGQPKACALAVRNALREGELPGLLPMVSEPPAWLRVQPQLTRHLDRQIAQVKPLLG